jgi:hypothetical protein
VLSTTASGKKLAAVGGTVITGAGTVSAGLTAVTQVVTSLQGPLPGTAAGNPWVVSGSAVAGSVVLNVYDATGTAATNAGTVHFIAYGT